jgi:DNA polymerase III beta subunit, central domain
MLRFNANLFRLAFTCASNEETRYYLKGVFVEPHLQGGVTLTATDGHRLVCIRDESGQADESAIINLGDAVKQCKAKAGATRIVAIETGESDATIFEERDGASGSFRVAIATAVRVDGTFPDYRRVVPQEFTNEGAPGFQGKYVSAFGDLACELAVHIGRKPAKHEQNRADTLRVLCGVDKVPESMPALILFPAVDIAFGVLMPCRIAKDAPVGTPAWFRAPVVPIAQAAE